MQTFVYLAGLGSQYGPDAVSIRIPGGNTQYLSPLCWRKLTQRYS